MPAEFTDDGLPVGFELLGAPFSDRRLVAFASAYEAATDLRRCPDEF
jgi:amidase